MGYLDEVAEVLGITDEMVDKYNKEFEIRSNCKNHIYRPWDNNPNRCKINLHGWDRCKVCEECIKYQKERK